MTLWKQVIVFVAACVVFVLWVAYAFAWGIEALNRTIDETNFIVDGRCSGTLISVHKRLVLTNYHCVSHKISTVEREETDAEGYVKKVKREERADVPVAQHSYNGFVKTGTAEYIAEIVAAERARDLALLQLKAKSIPQTYASPLLPDGAEIVRGEKVYVVGNPGMLDATVSSGEVSNVNRTFEFPWTGNRKTPMIQFSGGATGGSSGGALYNDTGQLIGVPSSGRRDATFLSYAIPIFTVKDFLREHCFASVFDPKADDEACRKEAESKSKKKDADD